MAALFALPNHQENTVKKPKIEVLSGGLHLPRTMQWHPKPLPPRVIKVKDRHTGNDIEIREGNPGHPSEAARQRRQDKQAARKKGLPLKVFLRKRG